MNEPWELPSGWRWSTVSEIADVLYGKANPKKSGAIPVLGSGGVYDHTSTALVEGPTVVIGRKGTAGQVWLTQEPSWPSDTAFYLRWRQEVSHKFVFYYLKSYEPRFVQTTATLPSLKREVVQATPVPIPPMEEQRRIVAKIEALLSRIREARSLREKALADADGVHRQIYNSIATEGQVRREILGDLLSEPLLNGLSVPKSKLGSGICFAKVGAVNSGVFDPQETKLVDIPLPDDSPYWLRKGDVLVSRGNTLDFVGRAAVYTGDPPRCAMPDLLIRVRVRHDVLDPHYLAAFFRSDEVRNYMRSKASGASSSMPKISQPKLAALEVPVPPLLEQERIVERLDTISARAIELRGIQRVTDGELVRLEQSILDRAFRGEL